MNEDASVINYSEIFSTLVKDDGVDDMVASFLYYMFPRELFIRGLSLLESSDMFIYVFDAMKGESSESEVSTDVDTSVNLSSKENIAASTTETQINAKDNSVDVTKNYLNKLYEDDDLLQYRLIVKSSSSDGIETPVYVDLHNWLCSCEEYTEIMRECLMADKDLVQEFVQLIDDFSCFRDDTFGQIEAHSLSLQKYVNTKKLLCPHLLAYSIILLSSPKVLRYYTVEKPGVIVIPITSIDEWLKLHINVLYSEKK